MKSGLFHMHNSVLCRIVLIVDEEVLGEVGRNGVVEVSEWKDILDRLLRRLDQVYCLRDMRMLTLELA
jgi:hypothetical protein